MLRAMRRHVSAGFMLAFALFATTPVLGDDAASLLAKNKAFARWAFGDPSMSGLLMTGTVGDRQIIDLRRGAIWRQEITDPKTRMSYDVGFTGKRFWYAGPNGFTVQLASDAIKYHVAYQIVMNQGLPLLAGKLRGTAKINGIPAQIVRVNPHDGDAIDAYIEPSSGRLVRAVIDPDGSPTKIDILAYADLDDKKVISAWHIDGPNVVMTEVDHARITDEDFHPPVPISKWTFGPPEPIPIAFSKTRLSVRATVNGVTGEFMLDTAAGSIFLNPNFAKRAGAKQVGTTVLGLSGATKGAIARVDTLAVGQSVLHNVLVRTSLDVRGPLQDFDGLLGFDFLAGALVDVDFTKSAMTIYDPSKYRVTAQGAPIPVDLISGQPNVPVVLNGRVNGHFLFDTGEPTALVATGKLYGPPHGVEMRSEYTAQSATNSTPVNCGHVQSIQIGGAVRYDNVPACFGDYGELFARDGGVIGLDFLRRFDLTFDYPDAMIYLTPLEK